MIIGTIIALVVFSFCVVNSLTFIPQIMIALLAIWIGYSLGSGVRYRAGTTWFVAGIFVIIAVFANCCIKEGSEFVTAGGLAWAQFFKWTAIASIVSLLIGCICPNAKIECEAERDLKAELAVSQDLGYSPVENELRTISASLHEIKRKL